MRETDRTTGERRVIALDMRLIDLSGITTRVSVGKQGRAAILAADGRVLGAPRHPEVNTRDKVKAILLKPLREAGFVFLAAAFEQWNADGRPPASAAFFRAGGETWIGRFRPLRVGTQELLIATIAPRGDFALGTLWDAGAIAAVMAGVLLLASLGARRFSRRFGDLVDQLAAESERIGNL